MNFPVIAIELRGCIFPAMNVLILPNERRTKRKAAALMAAALGKFV